MPSRETIDLQDTAYGRSTSVADDPVAEKKWSDERIDNLTIHFPHWLENEINEYATSCGQSFPETARELIEYAWMMVEYPDWGS